MKLNRKQKTIRNFLLAGVLLFTWWVLMGLPSFTQQQALRWVAQQKGLKEEPQVLCRLAEENLQDVIFTADGYVGRGRVQWNIIAAYADIRTLKPCDRVVIFAEENTAQRTADIFVYTEIPGAVQVECSLDICASVNNEPWEAVYQVSAAGENGVFHLLPECNRRKYEDTVFWDLCNAIENGKGDWDSRYTFHLTFHDSGGNIIETYEQTFERS